MIRSINVLEVDFSERFIRDSSSILLYDLAKIIIFINSLVERKKLLRIIELRRKPFRVNYANPISFSLKGNSSGTFGQHLKVMI